MIDKVTAFARGTIPVFLGRTRGSTRGTLELLRFAEDRGADGIVLVVPPYVTPTQDTVFEHFAAVAHAPRSLWARGRYAWPASGRVRGRGRAPFREARRLTSRPKAAAKTPQ